MPTSLTELPDAVYVDRPELLSKNTKILGKPIVISSCFNISDLYSFWRIFSNDPTIKGSYADSLPGTLEEFVAFCAHGRGYFWLIHLYGHLAGASWMHDVQHDNDGRLHAWMALYHVPDARRHPLLSGQDQRGIFYAAHQAGIDAIHAACRKTNKAAIGAIRKGGFTLVGEIERFAKFGSLWDSVLIYTLNPADSLDCWHLAEKRARKNREKQLITA